jgi:LPS export ABC transporter protein LptC
MRSDTLLPALPDVLEGEDALAGSRVEPIAPARPPGLPWYGRLLDRVWSALPLLLMGALALASGWWLQRAQAPGAAAPSDAVRSGAHDYALKGFRLQHFDGTGRLRLELRGESVSHLPRDDLWTMQGVRVRAWPQPHEIQQAWASEAQAWRRLQVLELSGGVELAHSRLGAPPLRVNALNVRWDTRLGQWDSQAPVQVVQGAQRFEAGTMRWEGPARRLSLGGGVSLRLDPAAQPAGRTDSALPP